MANQTPQIPFKAGDDFILTLTVTNKVNNTAVSAAATVVVAQAAYNIEFAKVAPNAETLATLLVTLNNAKAAYAAAIIVDITDWTITSSVRWTTKLINNFIVTKTNAANGIFTIECANTLTKLWKSRIHGVDVQFVINSKKSSSQTFHIDVKNDITMETVI